LRTSVAWQKAEDLRHERHQVALAAAVAMHLGKSVSQNAATQELLQLPSDKFQLEIAGIGILPQPLI
jgi:hypothetical protein